jgi:hypothetical protein
MLGLKKKNSEKLGEKLAFFVKNTAGFCKKIHNIGF